MPEALRGLAALAHRHAVLVVDDYEPLRDAFATMIALEGCDVETAATGAATLELLDGGYRPCLIVLDVRLPDMDGWEIRGRIQSDPLMAALPVVMVSGSRELLGGAPHPARVMLKPITSQTFRDAMAAHAVCAQAAS